ncbi:hypothetical protein C8R47DRAFT_1071995 [Mycena vitilis]|nr:hypothetical protein C8R47DRAFT_1071995 [Mycena vitilis]
MKAGNSMWRARQHLRDTGSTEDSITAGLQFGGVRGPRPQRVPETGQIPCITAALRSCEAIQEITSYQNAILRDIAPRLWKSGNETVEGVLDTDMSLRLPYWIPNDGPPQPTAFSTVEYQFCSPDAAPLPPRLERRDYAPGWRALTSVGSYCPYDGQLIFWTDKAVVEFPPGSTMLFPAEWMPFSFTEVGVPEWQMFISQYLDDALHQWLSNGCSRDEKAPARTEELETKRERAAAVAAAGLYPTVKEYEQYY